MLKDYMRKENKMVIGVINGPNMNLLGKREPMHYGNQSWDFIQGDMERTATELNCSLLFFQSNHEGEIVDFIQENMNEMQGIIINPAGYSKTGYAILDAIKAIDVPFIEVHMSNIFSRGEKHSDTVFCEDAIGNIIGFRGNSYLLALRAMVDYLHDMGLEQE